MSEQGDDNSAEVSAWTGADSSVMGRDVFGPGRGDRDLDWQGRWGEEPPYHALVIVLTHHERAPLAMRGGSTFTFVTDGIESALEPAQDAAGSGSVAIAGGAMTINQYLAAGRIDVLRLHVVPSRPAPG